MHDVHGDVSGMRRWQSASRANRGQSPKESIVCKTRTRRWRRRRVRPKIFDGWLQVHGGVVEFQGVCLPIPSGTGSRHGSSGRRWSQLIRRPVSWRPAAARRCCHWACTPRPHCGSHVAQPGGSTGPVQHLHASDKPTETTPWIRHRAPKIHTKEFKAAVYFDLLGSPEHPFVPNTSWEYRRSHARRKGQGHLYRAPRQSTSRPKPHHFEDH